jgi:hypothetical protein
MTRDQQLNSSVVAVARWQGFADLVGAISVTVRLSVKFWDKESVSVGIKVSGVQVNLGLKHIDWLRSGIGFIKNNKFEKTEIDQATKVEKPRAIKRNNKPGCCLICGTQVQVVVYIQTGDGFHSFRRGQSAIDGRTTDRGFNSVFHREKKYSFNSS